MRSFVTLSAAVVIASVAAPALAQPAQPQSPAQPAQPGAPVQPAQPQQPGGSPAAAPPVPDALQVATVSDLTAPVPGGITAEQVGARAMATSYQARAAEATLDAAGAQTDQAATNYVPRIDLLAKYTRLSNYTQPSFTGGGGIVVTTAPTGTQNPTPTFAAAFTFPFVLNQYVTQATITVPVSDYFLKISKGYTAATHAEDAARYDLVAARAKSYADGKIAYFTWLRTRGAVGVAVQSLDVAKAHLKDAQNQFSVGNASRADVLRAETQVAAAELAVARAKSGVAIALRQVRIAVHARDEERLEPGDSIDGPVTRPRADLKSLVAEAERQRPEIKSIDENAEAARKQAGVARANRYPSLSGFGQAIYANPNPRRVPQRDEWFPTWAVGAQLTWSPNDVIGASPASAQLEAQANALEAQKQSVRDGIELEVTQAYQSMLEADTAVGTTTRQLASALEGYRVARELFNNGRGTSTTLIDAENALAQARFDHLNARVDARLARVRLDHALGRDAKIAVR